eukprot:CAMPEP_0182584864 /NCGR_PEP_ID=MMETSP1324-20130603/58906_1 /TAXON_ID=236786 /ORGANISM="Florenciella sp., Strain RCC1587" /LENGTH=53 /DNA_ID=CAMNT_0024801613 /DNA_START=24 /DNA_END=181 /DNA_ORIENTATION=+
MGRQKLKIVVLRVTHVHLLELRVRDVLNGPLQRHTEPSAANPLSLTRRRYLPR